MTTFTRANPTADPLAQALGLVSWSYHPCISAVAISPTSQTIHFTSLWLPAGIPVGNLYFAITTVGAGTVPTSITVGLDNGSNIVAQSAELKSSAAWTTLGFQKAALSASYTPPASGYYRVCFLQNGAWGTTQFQFAGRTTAGMGATKTNLAAEPWGQGGTGQTALPSTGSALPSVAMGTNAIWVGAGT